MSHHMCVYFCSCNYNGVGSLFSFLRLLRQNVPSEDRTASKQLLRHLKQRKSQNFILFSLCVQWPLRGSEGVLPPGALPASFGGICLWQQVEKRSPIAGCKTSTGQIASLWMHLQMNAWYLTHLSMVSLHTLTALLEKKLLVFLQ